MAEQPAAVVVLITVPPDRALAIARSIVERRLAACANVVPGIRSIYWWEDQVQDDEEALLLVKTQRSALPSLTEHVRSLHPYTNPEVIALPVEQGSADLRHQGIGRMQSATRRRRVPFGVQSATTARSSRDARADARVGRRTPGWPSRMAVAGRWAIRATANSP